MPVYNYTTIDDPFAFGGSATSAIGINAAGQIVGYYGDASGTHGFLLSGGMYTPLDDPSAANQTMASGINDVGQIVGSFQHSSGTTHSFLYNPNGGTYTSVDAVAPDTEALGINDAGQIVGDYRDNTGAIHGFLLINGLHATIDDPLANPLSLGPNAFTIASGINNAGLVVGSFGILGTANHGFLYNPNGGTFTTLDDPLAGARGTVAYGINDAGEIVGSYYDASNRAHGFLYSGGTYITLDDPSAIGDTRAFGINDAGEIVGSYFVGSGAHGFLLTTRRLLPAPPPT